MISKVNNTLKLKALGMTMAGLVLLGGCAPPPRIEAMSTNVDQAITLPATSPLRGRISIGEVKFSNKTGIMSGQMMTIDDFKMALHTSLSANGYLSSDDNIAPLALNMDRQDTHKTQNGLDITWRISIAYQLIEKASGTILMDEVITSSGKAGFKNASLALMRDRAALEIAVRNNFRHGLYRLRLTLQNRFNS
jgi:hypothetical protein